MTGRYLNQSDAHRCEVAGGRRTYEPEGTVWECSVCGWVFEVRWGRWLLESRRRRRRRLGVRWWQREARS